MLSWLIVRDPGTVIEVTSAEAFRSGVRFRVEIVIRRLPEERDDAWALREDAFYGHRSTPPAAVVARWGVVLPDGRDIRGIDMFHQIPPVEPTPPTLTVHALGGGGDPAYSAHAMHLWLWPLPPAGPLDLALEWPALRIPETRIALDGAASHAEPLWPHV